MSARAAPRQITILRPDDWHLHLRDGDMLRRVLPDTAARFARAIVMPNLPSAVTTVAAAEAYRERICSALPRGLSFVPLMTLYLTDATTQDEVRRAKESGIIHAFKYYPAGATTHAENGVTRLDRVYPVLEAMERWDLPLLMHGEVTDPNVDVFDREAVFIDRHLTPLRRDFPGLRMVLEHITTLQAAAYVEEGDPRLAATITAHHLLLNRNALFQGGLRPHHYCLPILKRETHRQALLRVATSGHPQFFLGTDSAPHPQHAKEAACGCAGIYTAHAAIECYAEVFATAHALDRLEGFASRHGPAFYGLPINTETITLREESWVAPQQIGEAPQAVIPFRAGQTMAWRLVSPPATH